MRFFLPLACAIAVAACGGKAFTDDMDAGDGSAGDGGSGTDGGADAGVTTDASPKPDASPADCSKLSQELDQLRQTAKKCCPTCNAIQCDHMAQDLCCNFSFSLQSQAAVDEFEKKMKEFLQRCGPVNCPAIPCRTMPSLVCDPQTSLCQ